MSEQSNNTRREWLSRIGLAAGAFSALDACGPQGRQVTPASTPAKPDAVRQMFQVICHGMMAFRIWQGQQRIRIYMPNVMGHTYGAGEARSSPGFVGLMGGPYDLKGLTPNTIAPSISPTNVILTPSPGCGCDFIPQAETPMYSFAYVDIPMPDSYQGFRMARRTSGSGPIFKGTAATACNVNPATYFTVHVFRYKDVSGAPTLALAGNTVWTAGANLKLHLYAEPGFYMPDRLNHIKFLDSLFNSIDLEFADGYIATDPPAGDGSSIDPSDTESLCDKVGKGGDPTTCVAFFVTS